MDVMFIGKVILGNHTAEEFHAMAELWLAVLQTLSQTVNKLDVVEIQLIAVLLFLHVQEIHLQEDRWI